MKYDTRHEHDLPLTNDIPAEERLFMELSWDLGTARMAYEQIQKAERSPDTDDELDTELESIGADMRMGDALMRLSNRALELRSRIIPEAHDQNKPVEHTKSWSNSVAENAGANRAL